MQASPPRALRRAAGAYRALALWCFNCLLLFALLNLGAAGLLRLLPDPALDGAMTYGLDKLAAVYPDRDADEIRRLLAETWSRPYHYEPYTQFKESPYAGEFVNVGAEGFRDTGHGLSWPPAEGSRAVFVFGGSTTFGYGVADGEAIPARLQEALDMACSEPVAVYNLARSNYFSSQESILFARLLARGIVPAAAVFVDGLNEFGHPEDRPKFSDRLTYLMEETPAQMSRRWAVRLPLARLAKRWLGRRESVQQRGAASGEARELVERWRANRGQIRALAEAAGVATLFVWQPIPGYGYDLARHPFASAPGAGDEAAARGYEIVARLRDDPARPLGDDFLWLADLQRDRAPALYVDRAHYTAAFSREIALAIAAALAPRLCPPA